MTINKQTLIIVGASTAIGYLGDALTYSIAQTTGQGKPFEFSFPRGFKTVAQIIAAGVIGGFIIDYAVKKIERAAMSEEERALADLYDKEVALIQSGSRKGTIPASVLWSKAQVAAATA